MSHSGKVLDEVHILGPQIKEKQAPQVTLRAQPFREQTDLLNDNFGGGVACKTGDCAEGLLAVCQDVGRLDISELHCCSWVPILWF